MNQLALVTKSGLGQVFTPASVVVQGINLIGNIIELAEEKNNTESLLVQKNIVTIKVNTSALLIQEEQKAYELEVKRNNLLIESAQEDINFMKEVSQELELIEKEELNKLDILKSNSYDSKYEHQKYLGCLLMQSNYYLSKEI